MNTTGEAYLTISSTAPSSRLSMSARSRARWSGYSVNSISACDSALRVVSLPATTSRMKNEASSALVSCSPSMLAVTSAETRSSRGAWARSAASAGDQVGQRLPGAEQLEHRLVHVLGEELRVGPGQDDVGVGQDHVVLVAGDAHHVADDLQRQPGRDVRHEVARPGGQQVVDDRGGRAAHVVLELGDQPRAERAGDDPAQPGVPGIVHVDHRAEVLVELDRQVRDAGRALRPSRTRRGACSPRPRRRSRTRA